MNKLIISVLYCITSCLMMGSCSDGYAPLFDSNLTNADYNPAVWTVDAEGVIAASADDAIWTKVEYENFELAVEFKNDKCTNSGVVIYATDKKNWIPNAVEVQIADDWCDHFDAQASTGSCGAIYGHLAPSEFRLVKKPGEWNSMKIVAKGQDIKVWLNGKDITAMDMRLWTDGTKNPDGSDIPSWLPKPYAQLPTKGFIGFQGKHGDATIWFRNIRIKQL